MRDPETPLEQRLRSALRDEAAQAGPTVSSARLHAAARTRRRRERQWWTAAAAAVGIVAVAGAVTLGSLLPRDGVANPSPSDIAGSPTAPPTGIPTPAPTTTPTAVPTPAASGIDDVYVNPVGVPLGCRDVADASLPAIASDVFQDRIDPDFDNHPSAPALRAAAGTTVGEVALPALGWRLAAASPTGALYLAPGTLDLEDAKVFVHVTLAAGTWTIDATGPCRPELMSTRTAMAASWEIAPGASLDPATTRIPVLVTERACASGKPLGDRLLSPIVRYGDGWLGIGLEITMLEGPQDCQGNPATPVTISLRRPLGDRLLVDLGQYPFAEVATPAGS
jgi:hypothetical protein